jgi:hypothetical protein
MNEEYTPLGQNFGFLVEKTPKNVLNELKTQITQVQNNFNGTEKANNELVGQIQHEYRIKPLNHLKQFVRQLADRFEYQSTYIEENYNKFEYPNITLNFDNLWVNFQKKYEYNPVHQHYGVFSFVIWYQIPYTLENELKYHYSNQSVCHNGQFEFVYPAPFLISSQLNTYQLNIDKNKEGYIAIFPSTLSHVVYPFYSSDEYRITVAGNIKLKHDDN